MVDEMGRASVAYNKPLADAAGAAVGAGAIGEPVGGTGPGITGDMGGEEEEQMEVMDEDVGAYGGGIAYRRMRAG